MQQSRYDELILQLARLLVGKQVDTETVERSLELICSAFSFEHGVVYEVDSFGLLTLTECCDLVKMPVNVDLSNVRVTPKQQAGLAQTDVLYLERGVCTAPCETELLYCHGISALAVAPMTDEKHRLYGLIVFFSKNRAELLPDAAKVLTVPLTMLIRYVSLRMYQSKLLQAHASLESILDNTGIDIYVNDFNNHNILYINKSMAAPYGGQEQFRDKKCWQVLFPGQTGPCEFCPQKKLIDENGEPTRVYTWDYQRPFDGAWFRVFSAAFRWTDGRLAHVVSSADITDNKQKEALIEYMANYDSLTGLPNRRMLVQECDRRIDRATTAEQGYILFFDIDGFKSINDNYGHDAGDEFLIQLGRFFSGIPLLKDAIYRNGGDEFVAILGGEGVTKANIQNLAGFILARFKKPWILGFGQVICSTSIGVACFPEDGRTAEELLRCADMAMYQVKKSGGGGTCFGYQLQNGNITLKKEQNSCKWSNGGEPNGNRTKL